MAERVLVVDDDRQLTSFLERFLIKQGLLVTTAATATQMGLAMEHRAFDLVVLDVGLPDLDGFEVMRELRRNSRIPVILLTARDDVFDRIVGLELGADDYVTKPYEPRELLARIKSVLRRARPAEAAPNALPAVQKLHFAGFTLDLIARQLSDAAGGPVSLTSTEFSLLRALAERPGEAISRERILAHVYSAAATVTDRAIDAHIARLRKKIDAPGARHSMITTVHGIGYSFAAAVTSG